MPEGSWVLNVVSELPSSADGDIYGEGARGGEHLQRDTKNLQDGRESQRKTELLTCQGWNRNQALNPRPVCRMESATRHLQSTCIRRKPRFLKENTGDGVGVEVTPQTRTQALFWEIHLRYRIGSSANHVSTSPRTAFESALQKRQIKKKTTQKKNPSLEDAWTPALCVISIGSPCPGSILPTAWTVWQNRIGQNGVHQTNSEGVRMLPAQCQDDLGPGAGHAGRRYASLIQFYTFPRFDKSVPFSSQILTDRGLWTSVFGLGRQPAAPHGGTGARVCGINGQVKKKKETKGS